MTIPIIDAHLDLSWCALSWDRDLTQPINQIRQHETGMADSSGRGHATVSLEEMRRGDVALCLGTLIARAAQSGSGIKPPPEGPNRIDLDYGNQAIAYSIAQGQLAYYRLLESRGYIRLIRTRSELDAHWHAWTQPAGGEKIEPIGVVLSMEGADPIVTPDQATAWWEQGLRTVALAHYGPSAYAGGTSTNCPLTSAGCELLKVFEQLGMIVDVTHLSDESFTQVLDRFGGQIIASHHNCRALVPHQRQLADDQIRLLIERDAVIGAVFHTWMLRPGWKTGETPRELVTFDTVADHIDHICQLAGNVNHAAIGSDLDGGFGTEQTPAGLDTIADLQKLASVLASRGYSNEDVNSIFHGNWLRVLRNSLPQ